MAKKDENLKRLKELSELLGREPDMSGSAADIAQRVAELEEELGDVDGTSGQDTPLSQASALTGQENNEVSAQPDTVTDTADLVTVVALVTLHTDALHATRDEAVAFVLPGTAFRVSAGVAAEMTERGLARMQ
ncbi:DNA-packaging protein FI [Escherichia coli]|uniref:DNA-packaging protein FI n=1 Tax=Escherichia coli TaxID=562 RepID=UPI003529841D